MGLGDLWAVLRRRWLIILVSVLVVTSVAAFTSSRDTETSVAQSTVVLVDGVSADVAAYMPTRVARHSDRDFRSRTLFAVSEEVALVAVNLAGYEGDATNLVSNLTASEAVDKSTVTFTLVGEDPEMIVELVNAYADAYADHELKAQEERLEAAIEAVETLAEQRRDSITILDVPPDISQQLVTDVTLGDLAYDDALHLIDRLKLAQTLQEDPVIVIEYAAADGSDDAQESPYGMIAMGAVLGLVLGIMLALLAEYMDKRREAQVA